MLLHFAIPTSSLAWVREKLIPLKATVRCRATNNNLDVNHATSNGAFSMFIRFSFLCFIGFQFNDGVIKFGLMIIYGREEKLSSERQRKRKTRKLKTQNWNSCESPESCSTIKLVSCLVFDGFNCELWWKGFPFRTTDEGDGELRHKFLLIYWKT